jgi:hypothetical protein
MRALFAGLLALALAACGDDVATQRDGAVDAPLHDGGVGDATTTDASCFMNPQTHVEIINACTTAEKIDRQPVLPLLNPDGTLPPLP